MLTRDQFHHLIDFLPDDHFGSLSEAAERVVPPALLMALLAAEDDEPLTDEDRQALKEAEDAIARGAIVSNEDLKRELGL